MRITVHFTSQLRAALAKSSTEVELPAEARFGDLITALTQAHAGPFQAFVLDEAGNLRSTLVVCFDDQHVVPTFQSELWDGLVVTFLSPISGG